MLVAFPTPLLCERPLVWLPSAPFSCIFRLLKSPWRANIDEKSSKLAASSQARRAGAKSSKAMFSMCSCKRVLEKPPELVVGQREVLCKKLMNGRANGQTMILRYSLIASLCESIWLFWRPWCPLSAFIQTNNRPLVKKDPLLRVTALLFRGSLIH